MIALIKKLLANETVRYLIGGGSTTMVNLITFMALRLLTPISRNNCNVIAIIIAIVFAYFINKLFVFRSKTNSISDGIAEAISFFAARIVAMAIEVLGFAILCDTFRLNELIAKFGVQFIVIVANYVFSKLFVFGKKRRSFGQVLKEDYCYYIPFVAVSIVMLILWIAEEVVPFGGRTFTIVDSLHQYLPFFADYREKLLNEGSLYYSFSIAMGQNFMSLAAYYLASPFNLLLLLFPKKHLIIGINLILTFRVALSGTTMAYFLANAGKKNGEKPNKSITIPAIGIAYALSNYMLGYSWNLMWLDCLMIFPLVILGFQRLMEEKDAKLYVLSLFYCLYCNYYIGFIICVFLVLWFLFYNHKGFKKFFFHGVRFAIFSLAGGLMAAFMLVPAYLGISQTASASAKLPKWEWYGNIFELLKQQFMLTPPITNQTFDGGVNLYCGMLAIFAAFLYLFCKNISVQKKFTKVVLIAFLLVSFNSTTLNFVWHGMHDQYGIPNRFSFLLIFILLLMVHEVIEAYDGESIWQIVGLVIATSMATAYVIICPRYIENPLPGKIFRASIIMVSIYFLVFLLHSLKVYDKVCLRYLLASFLFIEVYVNGIFGMLDVGTANYADNYKTAADTEDAFQEVKRINAGNGNQFYRAELMEHNVLDEATWYSMPSVGTFCSTVYGEIVTTMGRLGFYTGANEFLYMGSTPFTNSIFDVQYLLRRDGELNNYAYNYVTMKSGVEIYENPYPLSVAFSVSDKVKEWDRDANLPMDNQNKLIDAMVGSSTIFDAKSVDFYCESDTSEVFSNGSKIFFTPTQTNDVNFTVSFYAEHSGDYYVNCRGDYVKNITFSINGNEFASDRYQIQIFHLGQLQKGDYVSIKYSFNTLALEQRNVSIYLATFDPVTYQDAYQRLSKDTMEVEAYEDGYIKGKIRVNEGQTVFTSIPYDKGWKLKVDGKKADYYTVCGAFIGIDLAPGVHEIELTYTPYGFYLGVLLSLVGVMIFAAGTFLYGKKKDEVSYEMSDNEKEAREELVQEEIEQDMTEKNIENTLENEDNHIDQNLNV